jgi:hypothetical protein
MTGTGVLQPTILMGHIMSDIRKASLFGIRELCKAGCQVLFNDNNCQIIYARKIILTRFKDPVSNIWTLPVLPIVDEMRTALDAPHQSPLGSCMSGAQCYAINFSYHQSTNKNNVKFMHQSLCNPPKASLLATIRQGFLHGAPHLSKKAVAKYLPPSHVMSKGHMKRPCKGLHSTTPRVLCIDVLATIPDLIMPGLIPPIEPADVSHTDPRFHFINNAENHLIANIFCLRAFSNKITGVVYNNCTDKFPFMLLNGNVCFFVMYHYKTNAILATPIPCLNLSSIPAAYKKNFEYLKEKGFKPKLNVMDNQVTKVIKAYITPQQVSLQLIEPHNHY